MTSTRSINMKTEYNLEQYSNHNIFDRNIYKHNTYGNPVNPGLPLAGSAPPSHMSRCVLSNNSIDIESQLFGIGSSNLVKKKEPVVPRLKKLNDIKFYERKDVLLPRDLLTTTNQFILPIT